MIANRQWRRPDACAPSSFKRPSAFFLKPLKGNLPGAPDSFRRLKNGRTTFGGFVGVVRKTLPGSGALQNLASNKNNLQ
jgi:hypothetical protein